MAAGVPPAATLFLFLPSVAWSNSQKNPILIPEWEQRLRREHAREIRENHPGFLSYS